LEKHGSSRILFATKEQKKGIPKRKSQSKIDGPEKLNRKKISISLLMAIFLIRSISGNLKINRRKTKSSL